MASPRRIYLDHAATTPLRPEVFAAMQPFLGGYDAGHFGNASSLYLEGRLARESLEEARELVRTSLEAEDFDVVFTGGGTEADNGAIFGMALAAKELRGVSSPSVITTAVEHPAILNTEATLRALNGTLVVVVVDRDGRVDPDAIEAAVDSATALVSVMAANNETGVIEPIGELGKRLRGRGVPLHTDAVQLLGKEPLSLADWPVDLVSISGHKVYGPKGVGALLVRRGIELQPLLRGGAQEGGLRAGTENVAAAVGFARATQLACGECVEQARVLGRLRDACRAGILDRLPWAVPNSPECGVLPQFLNLAFPRVEGESLVKVLDELGVAASTGSACNVGAKKTSHVLRAMGRTSDEIRGSLRLSFGRANLEDRPEEVVDRVVVGVERLSALSPKA